MKTPEKSLMAISTPTANPASTGIGLSENGRNESGQTGNGFTHKHNSRERYCIRTVSRDGVLIAEERICCHCGASLGYLSGEDKLREWEDGV